MENDFAMLVSYAIAVSLLTITPGVDTALVLQASFSKEKDSMLNAALGILLGCATWGLLVAFGLGTLITSNESLYFTLKTLGAVYLIWLGINALLKLRNNSVSDDTSIQKFDNFLSQGFFANMLNPKVGLFYISLLPQFIPQAANVFTYSLFLVFIHIMLSAIWFWLIAKTVNKSRRTIQSNRSARIVKALTGIIFISFGLKLLSAAR